MKKRLITALVSMLAVGTASADFSSDLQSDTFYGQTPSTELTNLPATAAGRSSEMEQQHSFGGMQDHPDERVSGI